MFSQIFAVCVCAYVVLSLVRHDLIIPIAFQARPKSSDSLDFLQNFHRNGAFRAGHIDKISAIRIC